MHIDKINTLVWELKVYRDIWKTTQLINHIEKLMKQKWEDFKPIFVTPSNSVELYERLFSSRWLNVPVVSLYNLWSDGHLDGTTIFVDDIEYILDKIIHKTLWKNVYTIHNI